MTGDQLWPLLAAFALFCWAVGLAYAHPVWVAGFAIALFAGEATFGAAPGVEIAGVVVYTRDAVLLAILSAGAARLAMRATRPAPSGMAGWAWSSLLLLTVLSLLRGVQSYGANLAGNDFRPAFYLLAGVIGIAAQPSRSSFVRDIVDVWTGVALLLVAVGMARLVGLTVGLPIDQQPFLNGRPLYASPTLFIAQAALLSFFGDALQSRWARFPGLPYLFTIAVLLFRHRTVWAAMVISLVAMWTTLRPEKPVIGTRVNRHWAGVFISGGVLVFILVAGKGASLERELTAATETATSQESTFMWRIEGWKALLDRQGADPQDLVVGIPYGAGYHREVFDAEVDYSPHSWYVQTVNRVGLLGCAMMVLALLTLSKRGRRGGLLPRNLGALLVLSTAVYGFAYYPPEVEGILLGLVVLSARHVRLTVHHGEQPATIPAPRLTPLAGAAPVAR
ncbi:MAG: hypothetical protein M3203_02025 [Actinomycetota bacterium]|nr:hypothetical protein [Actinomycetota bacterium]